MGDFISDGAVLTFDDFLQNYSLRAFLWQMDEKPEDGSDFIVTGDKEQLQPKEEEEEAKEPEKEDTNGANKDSAIDVDDDIMEVSPHANGSGDNKRPAEEGTESAAKKARVEGEEVTICEEKSAPTAEELKQKMKASQGEEGVVCIE